MSTECGLIQTTKRLKTKGLKKTVKERAICEKAEKDRNDFGTQTMAPNLFVFYRKCFLFLVVWGPLPDFHLFFFLNNYIYLLNSLF